jgi:hypothetical protein
MSFGTIIRSFTNNIWKVNATSGRITRIRGTGVIIVTNNTSMSNSSFRRFSIGITVISSTLITIIIRNFCVNTTGEV